eukprot:COSAG05_NODE_12110_length_483_cov_0.799479_1_plen_25_part_10
MYVKYGTEGISKLTLNFVNNYCARR